MGMFTRNMAGLITEAIGNLTIATNADYIKAQRTI
jgi:hypothetical protein